MYENDQQLTPGLTEQIADFKTSGQRVPKCCKANSIKPHQLRCQLKKEEKSS